MPGELLNSLPVKKPPDGVAGPSPLHNDSSNGPALLHRCPASSPFSVFQSSGDHFPPLPTQKAPNRPPSSLPQLADPLPDAAVAVSPRSWRKSLAAIVADERPPIVPQNRVSGTYKAYPRAVIYESEVQKLALQWQYTIIGKFTKMPPIAQIRLFVEKLALSGKYDVLWFDYKHVLIKCTNEFDMLKVWGKGLWRLNTDSVMRTFKYDVDFSPDKESAIAPVWIAFPQLRPVHYEKSCIFNLARQIGNPLKLDEPTAKGTRVSKARVCIEFDVRKPPPKFVCLHVCNDENPNERVEFWYPVIFEFIPPYCNKCSHLGHSDDNCKVFSDPSHRNGMRHLGKAGNLPTGKQVYIPKNKSKVEAENFIQVNVEAKNSGLRVEDSVLVVDVDKSGCVSGAKNNQGCYLSGEVDAICEAGKSFFVGVESPALDGHLDALEAEKSKAFDAIVQDSPCKVAEAGFVISNNTFSILDNINSEAQEVGHEIDNGVDGSIATDAGKSALVGVDDSVVVLQVDENEAGISASLEMVNHGNVEASTNSVAENTGTPGHSSPDPEIRTASDFSLTSGGNYQNVKVLSEGAASLELNDNTEVSSAPASAVRDNNFYARLVENWSPLKVVPNNHSLSPEDIEDILKKDVAGCSTPYDSVGFNTHLTKENFPVASPLEGNINERNKEDCIEEEYDHNRPPSPESHPRYMRSQSVDPQHRRLHGMRGTTFKSRLKIRSLDRHVPKKKKFFDYDYGDDYDFPYDEDYNFDPYY